MRNHTKCLLKTTVLGLACLGALGPTPVAMAADPEIPAPGLYWRLPQPDGLGNLNFALGATARLHAAPVELARVDRVVYLAGGSVIGQVANPPYAFDWTVAGSGAVTLRAEARDGDGAVQGWCERTIQVVGEGLQIAQSALAVTVATGATTSVNLDLTNLGPGDTEWAVHIQGGTAPGGVAGAIDKTFGNADALQGPMTYLDRGTVDPADDEIWIWDSAMNIFPYPERNYKIRRRGVSNWTDLGVFEKTDGDRISDYCQSAADGDRYWSFHYDNGAPGFSLIDVGTKAELQRIRLAGVPLTSWVSAYAVHPQGVVYHAYFDTAIAGSERFTMWQSRSRDGLLIASHGVVPSMKSATMGADTWRLNAGYVCWKDGYFWFYGGGNADATSVKLWRWTPGMDDAVMALSFPAGNSLNHSYAGICPAVEPGFVWVFTYDNETFNRHTDIRHVDTGFRPWLRPTSSSGTLANGASQSLTVQIDATTAPVGTYQAVLAITQYPSSLIPQILVPVTLTVTSGGSNQPPTLQSPAWAETPAVTLPAGTTVHVVASDPDGDPLTYAWSKVSGPGTATFATPAATDSGVTFGAVGTYVLRAAVSDGRGGSVTSDVSVAVTSDMDARADCNGDGVVNALDLQIVIANFGQTVP